MLVNLALGIATMILCLSLQALLLVAVLRYYVERNNLINNPSFWASLSVIKGVMLLLVVGVGVLSLSVISMRSSRATEWNQRARDNARLALLIAVGELQRTLGPDQPHQGPLPDPLVAGIHHLLEVVIADDPGGQLAAGTAYLRVDQIDFSSRYSRMECSISL